MKDERKTNQNCPSCNTTNVHYDGRMGGFAGYNDMYKCLECETVYTIMFMSEKPVHKMIIK